MKKIKSMIRRCLRVHAGKDIVPFNYTFSSLKRNLCSLETNNITKVIDIGANMGNYAKDLIDYGFAGDIISFEPIASLHKRLGEISKSHLNWIIGPRCALGASSAMANLNITNNLSSSSLLRSVEETELTRVCRKESVQTFRLDQVLLPFIKPEDRLFLKIDVQGYEEQVIAGAQGILENVFGMQIELSLCPQYEGQSLYRSFLDLLKEAGYDLWSIDPVLVEESGRMLQCDAVFYKSH
jgi:FkbM family methyltransferase